jgi:hypothetical protein
MNTPITKLPDGSAFFVAEIMSEEEAMKLPLHERPICFRISSGMYHDIFQSVGAASMCWQPRPSTEVFYTEEAEKIAANLCFKAAEEREAAIFKATKVVEQFFGGNPPTGLVDAILTIKP